MKLLKPPRLSAGNTVGVVAPSYPVAPFQKLYDQGIRNLKGFGFKVQEGKTVKLELMGYMSGTDVERAEDINKMSADKEVKTIVCAIGDKLRLELCVNWISI